MKKWVEVVTFSLKMLLGVMFCTSSILKLIDVDKFELYVYSYDFFSLGLSYIVARLCIAFELLLGIGLILNVFNKFFVRLSLLVLLGFTAFLAYAHFIGRGDNCHCFGEFLDFNPLQSIIKNIICIGAVLCCMKVKPYKFVPKWHIVLLVALAPFVAVFIISPPDNMVSYSANTKHQLNEELFTELIAEDGVLDTLGIAEGHKLVVFYSKGCGFCQMAAKKIFTMQRRNSVDANNIITVFAGDSGVDLSPFYEETETSPIFPTAFISPETFLNLTYGRFPLILLLEDGKVQEAFMYRSINENIIVDFLK